MQSTASPQKSQGGSTAPDCDQIYVLIHLLNSRAHSLIYTHTFFLLSLLLSHSFLSQINYCEAQAFGQSLELYYQYLQQKNKE